MIIIAPLPPGIKPDRDLDFTSQGEAMSVALDLQADPGMKGVDITLIVEPPPVPNTNDDGRLNYFVQFTRQEDQKFLDDQTGTRTAIQPVYYDLNCGQLLNFSTLQHGQPWKYNANAEAKVDGTLFYMGVAKK